VTGVLSALLLLVYWTLYDVWRVPEDDKQLSVSIKPMLEPGDLVLLARHGTPTFGQLARCLHPDQPGRFIIGRVIGEPTDVVDLAGEALSVNNRHEVSPGACAERSEMVVVNPNSQDEESLRCSREEFAGMTHGILTAGTGESPEAATHLVVEADRVALLSDNRHMHQDSRDYGQINPATCQHITFRLWSAAGIGDAAHRFTFIW
jgi:signal peptidase I